VDLVEEVYMQIILRLQHSRPNRVCKLNKRICNLKQTSRD